jgi:hypothetical protein
MDANLLDTKKFLEFKYCLEDFMVMVITLSKRNMLSASH